jgi:hypothetical protein
LGKGVTFDACLETFVDAYTEQCGNEKCAIPFRSVAAELCLNTTLELNSFGAHHCASISYPRAVRADEIIVIGGF